MEGRRRNNHRKSQNRKPPCGGAGSTNVEKAVEFCFLDCGCLLPIYVPLA
ncbi:hypothetical protein C2S51_010580 [Perilla frutescens var. frutescens]|nr:hypothetical protein C2S51_010580 [Perilla frutescens var. frutescens]